MAIEGFYTGLGIGLAVLGSGAGIGICTYLYQRGQAKIREETTKILEYRVRALEAMKEKLAPSAALEYLDRVAPLPGADLL